jgi:hypothetical protein
LVVVISLVSTIVVQNKATPSWSYSGRVEIILGFINMSLKSIIISKKVRRVVVSGIP